jgi:hypothetical protein
MPTLEDENLGRHKLTLGKIPFHPGTLLIDMPTLLTAPEEPTDM